MKILTQSKEQLINVPSELWITNNGTTKYMIVGTSYITPYLGEYSTYDKAASVLMEISESIKHDVKVYDMPSE